jgi:uncharacterized protein YggE
MVKRVVLVVAALGLVAAISLAGIWLFGQLTSPALAQTTEPAAAEYSPNQTITVVGQGTVRVQPDIAQVSIGIETSSATVAEAVQDNETQMTAILAALKAAGIADKDIQTMNYSIYLDSSSEPVPAVGTSGEGTAPVYRVSNMVQVTIRDLEKVGDVLDAVIEAGANNIWGVSFSVDDPTAAQADARAKAVEDALARAQALAELNGVTLGPVMAINEVVGGNVYPAAVQMEAARGAGGGSISPGELEISYQVQVSYFITAASEAPLGIPNPASKFCEDQGYKSENRTAADGSQTGYCVFPDGTECDEWAFFRGECGPGTPQP